MNHNDILVIRNDALRQIELADKAVAAACKLAACRLKVAGVPEWVLCELKTELKNFNMRTGTWNDK